MHPDGAKNGMQGSDVRSSSNSDSHNIYKQQDCYITGNIDVIHSDYEKDDDEGDKEEQNEHKIQQSVRKYLGRAVGGMKNYCENDEMEDDDDDDDEEMDEDEDEDEDEDQDDYDYHED